MSSSIHGVWESPTRAPYCSLCLHWLPAPCSVPTGALTVIWSGSHWVLIMEPFSYPGTWHGLADGKVGGGRALEMLEPLHPLGSCPCLSEKQL